MSPSSSRGTDVRATTGTGAIAILRNGVGVGVGAFVLVRLAEDDDLTGFTVPVVLAALSTVSAVLLLVCAVALPHRPPWLRDTVLGVEWVVLADAVFGAVFASFDGPVEPPALDGLLITDVGNHQVHSVDDDVLHLVAGEG
jgi:hypothetical protein